MSAMSIRGRVVTPDGVVEGGVVRIEGGRIAAVERAGAAPADVDLGAGWIVPGFVDVHVHGGGGHDFMDATAEAFEAIAAFHGRHGTTSLLATTVTASKDAIDGVLRTAAQYIADAPPRGARLLGVHLEGPFISPQWPGAQNPSHIVPPNADWLRDWTSVFPGLVKQLTLAPETDGAIELIRELRRLGIIAAAGHTDATYDQIVRAADNGLNQAVHTFNAMTPLRHREPGTAGAVLADERIAAEVIADGVHVHPAVVKLLTRAKSDNNLLLITDAMSAAGLGDGRFSLGGLDVTVEGGVARLTEGGNLAGSTLTMIDAFRFVIRHANLTVPEASRLASANAARQLRLEGEIGAIRPGAAADLVLLTPELDLAAVYRDGAPIA
ncbi:N-acetylglucosamine-6-phosphate deacetylase [Paenibacillus sp.]|uniref:N-acetylglucosamine-6-phosphate deacetylase n=1 Tax=Paenibacillus sp. TaxID=58172 RepID=UPI002D4C97DA|nr:N-acetylglucosamine-6-phosphate deacetylase [Paenibacillus sp.]HZG83495.1 N-acetylglucosamine-6-phosphate deacetylase [Paenibacillus sp.]